MPNFIKIRPVAAEMFYADGQYKDTHDEANSHFSQMCQRAHKLFTYTALIYWFL